MKYLKIELRQKPGNTTIIYPTNYEWEIGNFAVDHLYYDEKGKGWLLLLIPDKSFIPTMIRQYVEEITEVQVNQISEQFEPRIEKITDEAKIRRIEIKIQRNLSLTQEEEKALDPTNPTSGFEMEKILADRIVIKKLDEISNL